MHTILPTLFFCCALLPAVAAHAETPSNAPAAQAPTAATADGDAAAPRLTQGSIETTCPAVPPAASAVSDGVRNAKIPFKNVCFDDRIVPTSKTTYLQALKALFPDLADDGEGHATKVVPLRKELKADETWPGESEAFVLNHSLAYLLIEQKDQTQLVVFTEDIGILALYRVTPHFKLLDAIDVRQDRHASLMILQPYDALEVKPGVWLFPVSNWHDNSSQSYDDNLLFLTLDGKLRLAYAGPDLLTSRDPKHYACIDAENVVEMKRLDTQHEQFADISLQLSRTRTCDVENPKTGETTTHTVRETNYPATLYWDPQKRKYMGGSKGFVKAHKR